MSLAPASTGKPITIVGADQAGLTASLSALLTGRQQRARARARPPSQAATASRPLVRHQRGGHALAAAVFPPPPPTSRTRQSVSTTTPSAPAGARLQHSKYCDHREKTSLKS
jgi:hypothetical protein